MSEDLRTSTAVGASILERPIGLGGLFFISLMTAMEYWISVLQRRAFLYAVRSHRSSGSLERSSKRDRARLIEDSILSRSSVMKS